MFARWEPQVLQDYIEHGMVTPDATSTKCVLAFNREVETAIYNTLPDNLDGLLKRHRLTCPVAFIGGTFSKEMQQVGMEMTQQLVKGRIRMIDGSHLFPMEHPLLTAAALEQSILSI